VIQVLMGWEDDHLHRFRIHGRDYGIAYIGGPMFADDAAAVPLSAADWHARHVAAGIPERADATADAVHRLLATLEQRVSVPGHPGGGFPAVGCHVHRRMGSLDAFGSIDSVREPTWTFGSVQ
jgi:hypothetical protein